MPAVVPTTWSRVGAGCLMAMAATIAGARLTEASPQRYSAVLLGAVIAGAVLAAVGLWRTNRFEARLAAVVLALLSAGGQVLVATFGGPGTVHAHWYPAAFVVVALGCVVPVLIAVDTRARARSGGRRTDPAHPYAL